MKTLPSTEERMWAVLAHLSALAGGMGLALPIVGWAEQRRKSKYAAFHCLQALGYQSLGYTVWLLTYLLCAVVFLIFIVVMTGMAASNNFSSRVLMNTALTLFLVFLFGLMGLYMLLPIIAAIACALGKDFYYPIMGKQLASYLNYNPVQVDDEQGWLIEDHEDRWVTAMGHLSVIISLWGLLAPLTTWIMQGKRNLFIKFQAVQTLIYQAVVTILLFGSAFIFIFAVVLFPVLVYLGVGNAKLDSNAGFGGLIVLLAIMLFGVLMMLIMPLFHVMGQWAGYRVLKGDDYHYPILGKLIEKWMLSTDKNG